MKDSDLIAFPFNGVADNYPICFSNMTLKEKQEASLKRQSNRAILQSKTFNTLKPKNIMPYSSDIVILGPRAKDFVDVHPIEYVDRKLSNNELCDVISLKVFLLFPKPPPIQ